MSSEFLSHDTAGDALVARYFSGETTSEEAARVRASLPSVDMVPRALTPSVSPDVDAAWDVARGRVFREPRVSRAPGWWAPRSVGNSLGAPVMVRRIVYAAAATAAALLAVAVMRGRLVAPSETVSVRTYQTASGQQATVSLANGARAILGPATKISATTHASDGRTDVTVTGQALFTVTHTDRHVFIVRTENAMVRVLGTTFFVRRYERDDASRIAVTEGRVSLRRAGAGSSRDTGVVLSARTLGVIDDSGSIRVARGADAEEYTAWTTGRLVFRQTPVRDIVADVSRAYGADIRIADSALGRRAFTWTVSVGQLTLSEVLTVLTGLLDAHATQSGNVITIVPGPSPSRKSLRTPSTLETQYGR